MSEEEKDDSTIDEIKDLYYFLTEEEPTPDDEIEAKKILIEKFKDLKRSDKFQNEISSIERILEKLNEWDTLDHWFIETSLPEDLMDFLNIKDSEGKAEETLKKIEAHKRSQKVETTEKKVEKKSKEENNSDVDISEIISQVSAEFKDQIGGLEQRINSLQKQLEKKEEKISKLKKDEDTPTPKEMVETPEIEEKTPKKQSKLPPLEIELPKIKKVPSKSSAEQRKGENKEDLSSEEKEELDKEIPKISLEQLKKDLQQTEIKSKEEIKEVEEPKEKKEKKSLEKPTVKPVSVESSENFIDETTPEPMEISGENKEIKHEEKTPPKEVPVIKTEEIPPAPTHPSNQTELTPIPPPAEEEKGEIALPPKPKEKKQKEDMEKIPEVSEIESVSVESDESPTTQNEIEDQSEHLIETENEPQTEQSSKKSPSISIVTEETISESVETKETSKKGEPFAKVQVEETEAKESKASASDLYNVFSSMAEKNEQQKIKSKSKSKSKSKGHEIFINSNNQEEVEEKETSDLQFEEDLVEDISRTSVEELPRDKDLLYQELIALEGKRYSLEKTLNKLQDRYEKGTIDGSEFKNQIKKLQKTLTAITKRISELRSIIKSI
jgi:hypothetical protein